MKIIIHTMKGCKLCGQGKRLLEHWDLSYAEIIDAKMLDRTYPWFDVDGVEYSLEEIVDAIAKGKVGVA